MCESNSLEASPRATKRPIAMFLISHSTPNTNYYIFIPLTIIYVQLIEPFVSQLAQQLLILSQPVRQPTDRFNPIRSVSHPALLVRPTFEPIHKSFGSLQILLKANKTTEYEYIYIYNIHICISNKLLFKNIYYTDKRKHTNTYVQRTMMGRGKEEKEETVADF